MAKADSALSGSPIVPSPPRVAPARNLRILPLGNSITYGYLSSDGNGYRKVLLDTITANGSTVQYVGSVQAGNMTDNHNEGHPGATISQIATFANLSLPERPNIILLMAGTNDMAQSLNLSDAPRRLGDLIDQCHAACPDAVILVAQLTPATDNVTSSNIAAYNPTIPGLVSARVMNGVKALTVNMSSFLTTSDLIDGLHPNDIGYGKMATGWFQGLKEAQAKGWITPPM
jgi:lysophospholipase L1-like esterase